MAATMTVTEARAALPRVVDLVIAGHEVTITRHGEPVAVLVRPDALRHRRAQAAFDQAARLHDLLEDARSQPLGDPTLDARSAEEILAEIRRSRESR